MEHKTGPHRMLKKSSLSLLLLLQLTFTVAQNVPPTIVIGLPAGPMYVPGPFYTLQCLATGTPLLGYSWTLNGLPFNFNAYQATQDSKTGILSFGAGGPGGPYGYIQCTVSNSYGTAISNVTQVALVTLTSSGINTDHSYTVNPGASLRLPCDTSTVTTVPVSSIQWQLVASRISTTATAITTDQRVQMDETGTLNIAYVLASDTQNGNFYRCHFTNTQNNALELSISYSNVIVNTAATPIQPTSLSLMYSTPSPIYGLIGGTVLLRCFFGGAQTTSITWTTSNGNPVNSGGRFTVGTVTASGTLTITNVQLSDQGNYICTGTQIILPPASATLTLIVNAVPSFPASGGPQNGNYTVGGSATINCNTAAIPPATVTWYRNGIAINVAALPPKMSLSNNGTTLTISNLCKGCHDEGDLGVIQCNATNQYGSVFGQASISVFDATTITQLSPQSVTLQYPNPISFTCSAQTDIATPLTYSWLLNNQPLNNGLVNTSTPETVYIDIQNDANKGNEFLGTWSCLASNGISSAVANATVNRVPVQSWFWWSWIPLVIFFVLLLLLLLLLLCCCCLYRNRGNAYPVDEKERKQGNDPEKDLAESGFHDYQRSNNVGEHPVVMANGTELNGMPPTPAPRSPASINGSVGKIGSEDAMSFNNYTNNYNGNNDANNYGNNYANNYANVNAGYVANGYDEDGSFVDLYNPDSSRQKRQGPGVYSIA